MSNQNVMPTLSLHRTQISLSRNVKITLLTSRRVSLDPENVVNIVTRRSFGRLACGGGSFYLAVGYTLCRKFGGVQQGGDGGGVHTFLSLGGVSGFGSQDSVYRAG